MAEKDDDWKVQQEDGISMAKAQSVYRGRKRGSTKSPVEDAIKLRERGLSNPQIAKRLGISQRTVTRYVKSVRKPRSPIEVAIEQLTGDDISEILKLKISEESHPYRHAMQLVLLKELRHRKAKQFWRESPSEVQAQAGQIERLFRDFLNGCTETAFEE